MCEDNFANQKWSQQDSKFAAALKFNFGSATTTARVRGAGGRAGQGAAVWRLWLNYGKMWRGGHHGSTMAAPWRHCGCDRGPWLGDDVNAWKHSTEYPESNIYRF